MNVAICTPTAGSVKATYTASLLGLVGHYLQQPVPGLEDQERTMSYNLLIGSNIAQQREELIEDSLRDPTVTHVLFIDDDMGYQADCLNLVLSRRQPIVLANYRRKTQPWSFTCRRMDDEGRAHEIVTDELTLGLESVSFGGFGFCLIERAVLERIPRPRFRNEWIEHQQLHSTEDYPFFKAVAALGITAYVDHDLSRKVCHIGDYAYQYGTIPYGVRAKLSAPPDTVQEYKAA